MCGEVRKKFQKTNFTKPDIISFMKCGPKTVPGVADVGVLHGDGGGDGPRTSPKCLVGQKKFLMTNLT